MNWDYINDGLDPRGAEYSATRRAARSARNTERAMDDMLYLAAAPTERERQRRASEISSRRATEQRRGSFWRTINNGLALLLVIGIAAFMLSPDKSAVTRDAPANVSQGARDANAPVRQEISCDRDEFKASTPADAICTDDNLTTVDANSAQ